MYQLMKKAKIIITTFLALLVGAVAFAQNASTVSGTVTDSVTGDTVPGVAIQQVGSLTVYAFTDAEGKYSISVPGDAELLVTCQGYEDLTIPVAGRKVVNITLTPDSEVLDETIVVAFGTSTKESFTGSAKVVGETELAKSQVSAVTSALAGQVAGVQLTQSSGAPGSTPSIRIRGFSSISAGKEPLFIVDGAPYDGDINNLNPSDVENITVLKDAASNALYGARGANGVIIITTKGAKKQEAVVTVDAKVGVNSKGLQSYDVITDPAMYYETHYAALVNSYTFNGASAGAANVQANSVITGPANAGGLGYQIYTVPDGELFIGRNGKINPNATLGNVVTYKGEDYLITPDDWMKESYRNAIRQEYNVSVAGGNDKGHYYGSVGYLDNEGITYNSDMQRFTSRLKADYQAKKWLKVTGNMSYTKFNYNSLSDNGTSNSTGNIWAFASQMAPIYPLYVRDAQGNILKDENGLTMYDYGDGMNAGLTRPFMPNSNALSNNILNTRNSEGNAFSANGIADFTILPGLKFTLNASKTIDETRGTTVLNPYYGQFAGSGGTVSKSNSRSEAFNFQQLLNFNRSFGLHNVSLMLGHEYYLDEYKYLYASKQNMFSQDNKELAGAVIDGQSAYSYTSEYNNEGYFARAQYDYDSKIFVSGSFRRDASSRFAPEYRWGNFWSAGAAYLISKEDWFDVAWVDLLKIKASTGSQGNDNIGSYLYTDTYSISPSGGQVSVVFNSKGKKDITWETNTNTNAGVEFTLFNGLIDGSLEGFYRKTTDMLFAFSVSPSLGYSSYYDNIGDMVNYGGELSVNLNLVRKKNFQWSVNFNATRLRNEITYLADDVKTLTMEDHAGYTDGSYFIGENLPLYTRYLKSYAGVDPETGVSLWYKNIKDEDGNITGKETTSTYSEADYYLADGPIPELYGGIGTSLYFHGFDFSINCSYQLGGKAYDSGYAAFMSSPSAGDTGTNFHKDLLNAWTPENKSSNIPAFRYGDLYSAASSDRFLTDASYLNIENVNLGYTFPEKLTKPLGVSSLRLYIAAENLGYISARKGFDPRYSFTGSTNYSTYVPVRTVSGGVTFKF